MAPIDRDDPGGRGAPASPDGRTSGRSRPRRSVDPRLLLGLALVLVSVAGVVGVVRATDSTVPVYAAATVLVPGQRVDPADVVRRDVVLDGADRLYLRADAPPPADLVVIGTVRRGEIVPMAALGRSGDADSTTLVVSTAGRLGGAVTAGSAVDLWAADASADTTADAYPRVGPPEILVTDAVVVRVRDDDAGLVSRSDGEALELRVPKDRVARVLQAQADDRRLTAVPAGLPLAGAS